MREDQFQERVDRARERVAEGEITKGELHRWHHSAKLSEAHSNYGNNLIVLDAELAEAMPHSVKAHLPGYSAAQIAPDAKTAFAANSKPVASIHPTNP